MITKCSPTIYTKFVQLILVSDGENYGKTEEQYKLVVKLFKLSGWPTFWHGFYYTPNIPKPYRTLLNPFKHH